MKNIIIFIGFVFICAIMHAQQDAQSSLYMFNPLALNPAVAGTGDNISATLTERLQWIGIDGYPRTEALSINTPLHKTTGMGVGFTFIHDKIGNQRSLSAFGDVAYNTKLNTKNHRLSFGFKIGFDLFQTDLTTLNVVDQGDFVQGLQVNNRMLGNLGFGTYYYGDDFFAGFSVPRLLENLLTDLQNPSVSEQQRHTYIAGGYAYKVNPMFRLIPSVNVKITSNAPISLESNVSAFLYEKFWIGLIHRSGSSIGANFVITATNKLKIGYAYDYVYVFNKARSSHEIMLGYDIKIPGGGTQRPNYFYR